MSGTQEPDHGRAAGRPSGCRTIESPCSSTTPALPLTTACSWTSSTYGRIPSGSQGAKETRPGGSLIDTSFGLKEGETLVVGTSKVGGSNDALVVLVTAVPAP